jgi:predicted PurR-regulated permease PerM
VVAILTSVLLSGIGLRYASVVGIFAGLANTIPYFGPLLGFMAAVIVGVAQTGDLVLFPGILAAMVIAQIVDNVLQPFIFSRAIRIHPLVILCTVIIGAELGGIIGMLLSIPVITVLWVTAKSISWSVQNYWVFRTS